MEHEHSRPSPRITWKCSAQCKHGVTKRSEFSVRKACPILLTKAMNGLPFITCCCIALLGAHKTFAQTNVPIPNAMQILKLLHNEHPRLFANADQFAALKKR